MAYGKWIFLSQPKYVTNLSVLFHISDFKPDPTPFQPGVKLIVQCTTPLVGATLYHQLIASLIYLTHIIIQLSFVINMVSRFMQQPQESCWDSEISYFHPLYLSLFLTFHPPINLSLHHSHTYIHQRKFQFKMGLPKIIQIPCHHVLASQNALKFKKGAPLKQFFNINLGIGIIKKLLFLFVFSTYLLVFLIKFRLGELLRCGIKLRIQ